MTTKILCVDDEPNILSGYQRSLRKQFEIEIAFSGAEALQKIEDAGPFAILLTDMRMPVMDGVSFLKEAQKTAPDSVRIMLTGNADQQTAASAVNDGQVFRFLNKPCGAEELSQALTAGLEQYRLVTAEKELLEKTLGGTIRVLMEILALVDPELFGRSQTLRLHMRRLSAELKAQGTFSAEKLWPLELAALLSQIGAVTVPAFVVGKVRQGTPLTEAEQGMWQNVPEVSHNLIRSIPRLEPVAEIIRYQHKYFDGSGAPTGPICGELIPPGSRILKVLLDLLEIEGRSISRSGAFALMQRQSRRYDPVVLAAAYRCFVKTESPAPAVPSIPEPLQDLCAGQVLTQDVQSADGKVLLTAGRRLNEVTLEKLRNYAVLAGVREPIYVQSDS